MRPLERGRGGADEDAPALGIRRDAEALQDRREVIGGPARPVRLMPEDDLARDRRRAGVLCRVYNKILLNIYLALLCRVKHR